MQLQQYTELHKSQPSYGAGLRHYEYLKVIIANFGFSTALDYGCGKGRMADALNNDRVIRCKKFDPAIREFNLKPDGFFDLLINSDVLEHVPEHLLNEVLLDFKTLSNTAVIIPHLAKASAVLSSGENAHCTIKTRDEWHAFLALYYKYVIQLDHDSCVHALFFCSDEDFNCSVLLKMISLQAEVLRQKRHIKTLENSLKTRTLTGPSRVSGTDFPLVRSGNFSVSECIKFSKDFTADFMESTVELPARPPFLSRHRDFDSHIANLEGEFGGKPRFVYVHCALIVAIRRKINLEWCLRQFRNLWETKSDNLLENLSLRWLISAADTFSDFPKDDVERVTASACSLLCNFVKLVETERHIEGRSQDVVPVNPTKGVYLFDGMTAFRVKKGDMIQNLFNRLSFIYPLSFPSGIIFQESINRIKSNPTTLARLECLKRTKCDINI